MEVVRRKWGWEDEENGDEEARKGQFLGGVGDGIRRRGQQWKNI